MIAYCFSHWGLTLAPDNDFIGNAIVYEDGSFERFEPDKPFYLKGRRPTWVEYPNAASRLIRLPPE